MRSVVQTVVVTFLFFSLNGLAAEEAKFSSSNVQQKQLLIHNSNRMIMEDTAEEEYHQRQLIRNGKDALPNDFPYVVELLKGVGGKETKDIDGAMICTGTRVASNMILTAGHCIDKSPKHVRMVLDNNDETKGIFDLHQAILHPNYMDASESKDHHHHHNGYIKHDVMLLLLKEDKANDDYDESSSLAILNFDSSIPQNGTVLTSLGYGHTNEDHSPTFPDTLQQLESSYETNNDCFWDNVHNKNDEETEEATNVANTADDVESSDATWIETWLDSYLCTNSGVGMGHCGGDSGGPVMLLSDDDNGTTVDLPQSNLQVGIMSVGMKPCGSNDLPDVNARVSTHAKWIRKQICIYASKNRPPSYLNCTKKEKEQNHTSHHHQKIHPVDPLQHASSSVATVTLTIVHDMYASEISWFIKDAETDLIVAASSTDGYTNDEEIVEKIQLIYGRKYDFTIKDSMGDGICCSKSHDLGESSKRNGHYRLVDTKTGTRILDEMGDYGFERINYDIVVTGQPKIQVNKAVVAVILLNLAIIIFCLSFIVVLGCADRHHERQKRAGVELDALTVDL